MTKLLLVEDDESLGATLSERLREEGYGVAWAKSNSEAELEFDKGDVALIILDIGLPDGSGFRLARHVKVRANTPIVFLTAMNSAENRLEGFELGASDYIPKPFHLKELLLRVSRVLESRGIRKGMEVGGIRINPDAMSVTLPGGEEEYPAVRDFEILKLLVSCAPRVLSRAEIHQRLWPEDNSSNSFRSIDNAVVRLRSMFRKVSESAEFIRSVRGVGYQWIYEK